MEHTLKNGKTVIIRKPTTNDAKGIINLISSADKETKFLAREPEEFDITEEQEKEFITNILRDNDMEWFIAEYQGEITGQGSVGLVKKYKRYRHRAEVSVVVSKDCWGLGIGGKLMEQCIDWCKKKGITQIELSVIADNKRAVKMYEDFGFRQTGVIPKAVRYSDGKYADEKLMVLEL